MILKLTILFKRGRNIASVRSDLSLNFIRHGSSRKGERVAQDEIHQTQHTCITEFMYKSYRVLRKTHPVEKSEENDAALYILSFSLT
jgi:hypothetical protein